MKVSVLSWSYLYLICSYEYGVKFYNLVASWSSFSYTFLAILAATLYESINHWSETIVVSPWFRARRRLSKCTLSWNKHPQLNQFTDAHTNARTHTHMNTCNRGHTKMYNHINEDMCTEVSYQQWGTKICVWHFTRNWGQHIQYIIFLYCEHNPYYMQGLCNLQLFMFAWWRIVLFHGCPWPN